MEAHALLSLALVCLSARPCAPSPQRRSGCFKVNDCKCIMKDGSGVISLRAMGDAGGFLGRLLPLSAEGGALLSFSPCRPFRLPEGPGASQCTDVAACLSVRSPEESSFINYGRHKGNEFHYNDSLKVLTVSYFTEQEPPLTVVHYHCSPNRSSSSILRARLPAEGPLRIWVESPCACPNACAFGDLGLGTIFLIMLCVSAVAYFVLGSCALRPVRGSGGGGVQLSPEPSVWCMICYHCSENRPDARHCPDPRHSPGQ